MIDDNSSFDEIRQHIHKMWGAATKEQQGSAETIVFIRGQNFLDNGTIPLEDVFALYKAELIFLRQIEIEPYLDEFEVVELSPSFKAACLIYERPSHFLPRGEGMDEYDKPNGYDEDEAECDFDDYRDGMIHLMSETKLRASLQNTDHKWLIYRTPYRPETEVELRKPLSEVLYSPNNYG